jgi:hypothetical protein
VANLRFTLGLGAEAGSGLGSGDLAVGAALESAAAGGDAAGGDAAGAIARLQTLDGLIQGAIARLEAGSAAAGPGELGAIAAAVAELGAQLNPATLQAPDGMGEGRWRAIAVELHRQLRLLELDGQFLRMAKQPDTLRRRLQQMAERLDPLRQYLQWRGDGGAIAAADAEVRD